jgi:hypothetical protein
MGLAMQSSQTGSGIPPKVKDAIHGGVLILLVCLCYGFLLICSLFQISNKAFFSNLVDIVISRCICLIRLGYCILDWMLYLDDDDV